MRCPRCNHTESLVLDTRRSGAGQLVRRRRRCVNCEHKFTTLESVVSKQPTLSADDKRIIRRAIDRIVAVLGIPSK